MVSARRREGAARCGVQEEKMEKTGGAALALKGGRADTHVFGVSGIESRLYHWGIKWNPTDS